MNKKIKYKNGFLSRFFVVKIRFWHAAVYMLIVFCRIFNHSVIDDEKSK